MLDLNCTMISSVDLAHYGVSHAKDWVSVNCGTNVGKSILIRLRVFCFVLWANYFCKPVRRH